MPNELELLKHTDIFVDVPEEQLAKLAARAHKRNYETGQVVFSGGDLGASAFVVEFGEVKLTIQSPADQEITLAHRAEGDVFGELSLFDGAPRSAAAVAITDTRCLVLRRDDFLDVLDAEPSMARALMSSLARTIRHMNEVLGDVVTHPHLRIAKTLLELGQTHGHRTEVGLKIDRPVTDADLASMTGLFTTEVGLLLANLQLRDVVRRDGAQMTIVRPDELREAAKKY